MKIKLLKFLLIGAALIPALGIFFFASTKVQAANCTDQGAFDITSVVAEEYIDQGSTVNTPKVMPGDKVQVTVKNNCDTNNIKYNIFIHPASIIPDGANIDSYLKVDGLVLLPSKDHMSNIEIQGTEPGNYKIRVVAWLLKADGSIEKRLGDKSKDLIIATNGIVFSSDNKSSLVKNDVGQYTIKVFGGRGKKLSIYIDSTDVDNLKKENIAITSDEFTYSGFSWDTSGTSIGSHKVIALLNDGQSASFAVSITDPAQAGSSSTSGFSLSKLDSFNIKNLLSKCRTQTDLNGITCMVDEVINWLLDIGAVISLIMILYASAIYLTSYGDESKAELAKKTLIWSVIGVAVIGAAMAIMKIIENTLTP